MSQCQYRDCAYYGQGHPACLDCWRGQGLADRYQPQAACYEQGRVCNLLGQAWEEYCLSRLSKRHAVQVLTHIQAAQALVMQENST